MSQNKMPYFIFLMILYINRRVTDPSKYQDYMQPDRGYSDSFTMLGLWVLGLAVFHINESNCKLMSPEH